jgi:hypothetical protein
VHNSVDKALEQHEDPQRPAHKNYRAYIDKFPNVKPIPQIGYEPWKKGDKAPTILPSLVSDKTVSISSRREIKAEQAQMFKMEQSPLKYDLRQKRFGSDIPGIDKHIQTDIIVGSNDNNM